MNPGIGADGAVGTGGSRSPSMQRTWWRGMMFNLYTNPREDMSDGVRHIPIASPVAGEIRRYQEVLKKYPPKTQLSARRAV